MWNRDSLVLWLGLAIAVVGYLANAKPPTEWGYAEWIQAASFVLAWVSGKLATSPLPGAPKGDQVDVKKLGTMVVLAVVVTGLAVTGCGPKTKATLIKADGAVYYSVRAIHDTAIVLGDTAVITPAQELKLQQALLPVSKLGEQATRVIAAWKSGPTPPELQQLIRELGALTQTIVEIVPQNPSAKAALMEKIALAQQAVLVVLTIMAGGA